MFIACRMLPHAIDVNNLRYVFSFIFHICLYFCNFPFNIINIIFFHDYHKNARFRSFCFHVGWQLSTISMNKILVS